MNSQPGTDLSVDAFLALRGRFFAADATPKSYRLRDKRNTQDDPLDEHIGHVLSAGLRPGIGVARASGPLITPDLAILRPDRCDAVQREELRADSTRILGLEIKKLQRQPTGKIARSSGMDYNTTPPCGTVRIYDREGAVLDVKGYYLFVCQEAVPNSPGGYRMTALVLCDGNLLNEDFEYYVSVVGPRSKEIGLGTYADGANRNRPMIIFSNPLGISFLDHHSTLIHARDDLEASHPDLCHIGAIERTVPGAPNPGIRSFHCYRDRRDVPANAEAFRIRDPFPTLRRTEKTVARGRFIVDVLPAG